MDPGEALGLKVCRLGQQGLSAVFHQGASPSGLPPGWTGPAPGLEGHHSYRTPGWSVNARARIEDLGGTEDRPGVSTGRRHKGKR
jgi:hypothetical protein